MDSGNSGSMQSSSGGGDDESYDSRVETSISTFLGPTVQHRQHQQQQSSMQHHRHHQHHQQQVEFDSLSNIFNVSSRETPLANSNPLLNLDMVWPTNKLPMRSDGQINSNLISQPFLTHSQLGVQVSSGGAGGGGGASTTFTHQIPNDQPVNTTNNNYNVGSGSGGVRSTNPKKRSRASRRAPTTVLTTDKTNFRAMVQEFTGIPAPPFTSSSSFPRSRLDLFGSSSSARSIPSHQNSNHNIPDLASSLPPYLLTRPFPHKAPLPNAITNSPLLNINTMQNPPSSSSSVLNFQSLFQNPQHNLQKYPLPTSGNNILGSSSKSSQGSLGNLCEDRFGLSHGLNIQQQQQPRTSTMNWVDNSNKNEGNVDLLRSINANNQPNYGASSSSNVVDKAGLVVQLENSSTARNEGTMDHQEPWICTSD